MSLYHCGGLLVEEPNSPLTVSTTDYLFYTPYSRYNFLSNIEQECDQVQWLYVVDVFIILWSEADLTIWEETLQKSMLIQSVDNEM